MENQSSLIIGAAIIGAIGAIIGGLCSWYGSKMAIEYQLKEKQKVKRKIILTYLKITVAKVSSYLNCPAELTAVNFVPNTAMWTILSEAAFTEDEYDSIARWLFNITMLKEGYIVVANIPGFSQCSKEKKEEELRKIYYNLDENKETFTKVSNIIKI